ncbi:MAG: FtsX-like permease family protein, partial [Xanthomonadales bacterium]|nr:FtsX-like permease family protein [Xanthomonadales bacterium]
RDTVARPSGLDEPNVFVAATNLFDQQVDQQALWIDDLDALRQLPGVAAAAPIQSVPNSGSGWGEDLYTSPEQTSDQSVGFGMFMSDEHGLDALGVELVAGRNFRPGDIVWTRPTEFEMPRVIMVSQALADAAFPEGNAVGQIIWDEPNAEPSEIIGVYDEMIHAWPGAIRPLTEHSAIIPVIQLDGEMRYVVRAEPGERDRVMALAEEYLAQHRGRLVRFVRSFEEFKTNYYDGDIAMIKLLTGVIVLLTLITAFGIVGLAWFSVTQRRKQIGTRRALGARRVDIMRYFMVENWIITTAGLVLGALGAVALNWWLDTHYEVGRMPLFYLPLGMLLLWLLGQLAVLAPARRAANIPPALATRSA